MNAFNTQIANSQELAVPSPPDQLILDSYFSLENTVLDREPTSLESPIHRIRQGTKKSIQQIERKK